MPIYNEDGNIAIRDDLYLGTTIRSANGLRSIFAALELTGKQVILKPNWFCELPGQYTDAVTLEMVLDALEGPVVIVEGHSMLRNDGTRPVSAKNASGEWKWICEQEMDYLIRTGLWDVMQKYNAQYVNVTDEIWSGRIVDPTETARKVSARFEPLKYREVYGMLPEKLADYAGTPLISLARFKAPGSGHVPSLSLKNMFGLIPDPDRSAYHADLAEAVIDINLLYASYFPVYGVVEGVKSIVIPDERGPYEAPWGKYSLLEKPGFVSAGVKQSEADVLAYLAVNPALVPDEFLDRVAARYQDWDRMLPLEAERFVPEISL